MKIERTNKRTGKVTSTEYTEVKDRILEFNKKYVNGCIKTKILSQDDGVITMKAYVYPEVTIPERYFTGTAQEWKDDPSSFVNKTSYIENCETSAVGRALAMMGIGVIDSVASADEIEIANRKAKYHGYETKDEFHKNLPPIPIEDFDSGKVCKKCGNPELEVRISQSAKNPGKEYMYCSLCRGFSHWKEDVLSDEELNKKLDEEAENTDGEISDGFLEGIDAEVETSEKANKKIKTQ